jgi:hypothetical protein
MFTDAYASYESAILDVFGRRYPQKARDAKPLIRWPQGIAYGQVKQIYQGNRVECVEVRAVHGKARLMHVLYLLGYKQMNTSVVERHNGTSRLRNQRKVRKTLAFAKATRYHGWMSGLAVGLYNFCRPHNNLKIKPETRMIPRSPALAAGLTDHIWSTREWLLRSCTGAGRIFRRAWHLPWLPSMC